MFISILVVILSLYVTVFVHEWAHYIVARRLGVKATALNLGIGPILLSHAGELKINIRLMPIGGYLDIPDMTFFKPSILSRKHRCYIAIAGPLGNLALCISLAITLSIVGIPIYGSSLTIGYVAETFPDITLKPGDCIVSVNGHKPKNWNFLLNEAFSHSETNLQIVAQRGNVFITNTIPIILPGIVTPKLPISPVQKLLRRPDPMVNQKILSVDNSPYFNADTFEAARRTNKTVQIIYSEQGTKHSAEWTVTESLLYSIWEYEPPIVYADPVTLVFGTASTFCVSLWSMIKPESNLHIQNMSGPLTTMLYLHRWFDTDIRLGLFLTLALNLNLMLFNLLPIYPMDGSHIMAALLERTRFINIYKKITYFLTWSILIFLVWMLLLDVIKVSIL